MKLAGPCYCKTEFGSASPGATGRYIHPGSCGDGRVREQKAFMVSDEAVTAITDLY